MIEYAKTDMGKKLVQGVINNFGATARPSRWRGARSALELGTLAGYSALWIARGLAPDGRLVTVFHELYAV